MRLLVTIPHFYRQIPGDDGYYGSERDSEAVRTQSVARCIASLHQTFGPRQALYDRRSLACNAALSMTIDVVLVTAAADHLAAALPRGLFKHVAVDTDPRHLGFACQSLMRQLADGYDWFAYLEDDIEVTDPLLFAKLGWFIEQFGPSALLQPNRFEVVEGRVGAKLYVDGELKYPSTTGRFQDITQRPALEAAVFGRPVRFERAANPHSGCFFASAQQLGRMAQSPLFGEPGEDFIGPLETAATMMIMRMFDVYKPVPENAGFLEVRHLGRRFMYDDGRVKTDPTADE
jgi:hypothetical protein